MSSQLSWFIFSTDFTDTPWTPTSWDSTFLFLHEQSCHKSWFLSSRQMKCDPASSSCLFSVFQVCTHHILTLHSVFYSAGIYCFKERWAWETLRSLCIDGDKIMAMNWLHSWRKYSTKIEKWMVRGKVIQLHEFSHPNHSGILCSEGWGS